MPSSNATHDSSTSRNSEHLAERLRGVLKGQMLLTREARAAIQEAICALLSARSENSLTTREQFILAFIKTCAGPAFDREEIRAEANHILAGKLVYAKEAGRDRI